jgi:hypothetical protein
LRISLDCEARQRGPALIAAWAVFAWPAQVLALQLLSTEIESRGIVDDFRKEISAVAPIEIVVFFSKWNLSELQNRLLSAGASLSNVCQEVEEERENGVLVEYRYAGDSRFAKRRDQKRYKFAPGTDGRPRYSEWMVTREYEEPAGHRTVQICTRNCGAEEKRVDNHSPHSWRGFSSHDHHHFTIIRSVPSRQSCVFFLLRILISSRGQPRN